MAHTPERRGQLFRKYVVTLLALVSAILLTSGTLDIYFTYRENERTLALSLQREALAAAEIIERSVRDVERQVRSVSQPLGVQGVPDLDQRRLDYLRVFGQAGFHELMITDLRYLHASGSERLWVARNGSVVQDSQTDFSWDPRFLGAGSASAYFSPVEHPPAGGQPVGPFVSVAIAERGPLGGVTVAEVALNRLWEAVVGIKIGRSGRTYVVDGQGRLIAHPARNDPDRDVSAWPQVERALSGPSRPVDPLIELTIGPPVEPTDDPDRVRGQVVTAWAIVPATGWLVFVEQPTGEAFAPIYAAMVRAGLLLLLGLVLAILASVLLARRMVAPIRALQVGAARIGAGNLDQQITVRTGDELEGLADGFNAMSVQLQESYANLKQRVRLEAELARAGQVQAELLPRDTPTLHGFELAARCVPAREVGGDFYDWQEPAPGLVTISVGDVMGKGMSAALLMATVRANLRGVAAQNPPAVAMGLAGQALEIDLERSDSFVTLFHAQLNVKDRQLSYVDAGHGHVFMRREEGTVETLTPRGLPLGVPAEERYQEGRLTFRAGDALVLYSDGLIEARPDLALDCFVLSAHLAGATGAQEMVDRLIELTAPSGPPPDDMTVVVLQCTT